MFRKKHNPTIKKTPKPDYYTQTLLVLIIVLIGVSAYTFIRFVVKKPVKFDEVVMCTDCNHIFILSHTKDEKPPFVCEKCGKKTALPLFHCKKCNLYFPSMPPVHGVELICPRCSSQDIETVHQIPVEQK